jgi:hypothetical protein
MDAVTVRRDIEYAAGRMLDLYLLLDSAEPLPAVLFVTGFADAGSKRDSAAS